MRVRVVVESADSAVADAVFAASERAAEPLGFALSLTHVTDADALADALDAVAGEADLLILTPRPGTASPPRIGALGPFTVEVQPDNIAAAGITAAGADAEIFGLGMAGYAHAVSLAAERLS